jgi:hypothetical protein
MMLADALSGRAGIDGVRWMLLGAGPQSAVHRVLGGLLRDGHSLTRCDLYRAKFKPGRKLSAWYLVEIGGDERGPCVRHAAVTWVCDDADRGGWSEPVALLEHEAADRGLLAPFRALHARVPEWRMRVYVSPLDERFPALVRLSDPAYAAGLVPDCDGTLPAVRVVRYRPGERHVLRYEPGCPGPRAPVIVKLYLGADAARTVWRRAMLTAEVLAAAGGGLRAVRPLALLAGDHAVLLPCVAGPPDAPTPARLRRVGTELERLHAAPAAPFAPDARNGGFEQEAAAVLRAASHIHALLPRVGASLRTTVEKAVAAAGELPQEDGVLVHGDCKLDHFLDSGGRLILIDLDRSGPGDPAVDVGKLAGDLRWRHAAAGRPGAERAVRAFLDGYFGGAESPRSKRARLYESMLVLKIAARRAQLFDRRWADLTTELTATAQDLLAAADAPGGLRSRQVGTVS